MTKKPLVTPIEAGFLEENWDDPAVLEFAASPFIQWLFRLSAREMSKRDG